MRHWTWPLRIENPYECLPRRQELGQRRPSNSQGHATAVGVVRTHSLKRHIKLNALSSEMKTNAPEEVLKFENVTLPRTAEKFGAHGMGSLALYSMRQQPPLREVGCESVTLFQSQASQRA